MGSIMNVLSPFCAKPSLSKSNNSTIRTALCLTLIPSTVSVLSKSANAQDEISKRISVIVAAADSICGIAIRAGSASSNEVAGEIHAKIPGLVKYLADAGTSVDASTVRDSFDNVMQKDLPTRLKDVQECRMKVFDTLQDKLIPAYKFSPTKPKTNEHVVYKPRTLHRQYGIDKSTSEIELAALILRPTQVEAFGVRLGEKWPNMRNHYWLLKYNNPYGMMYVRQALLHVNDEEPQLPISIEAQGLETVQSLDFDIKDQKNGDCSRSQLATQIRQQANSIWTLRHEYKSHNDFWTEFETKTGLWWILYQSGSNCRVAISYKVDNPEE